jgi:hypothetical protein
VESAHHSAIRARPGGAQIAVRCANWSRAIKALHPRRIVKDQHPTGAD